MTKPKAIDYRAMQDELTAIIAELQSDELDIDTAIKKYERAQTIIAELETYLEAAELKIKAVQTAFHQSS